MLFDDRLADGEAQARAAALARVGGVGLREAFEHDGPALIDVVTARQELSIPPTITAEQAGGFTLYALRTVMSGRGDELLDLANTNVLRRIFD